MLATESPAKGTALERSVADGEGDGLEERAEKGQPFPPDSRPYQTNPRSHPITPRKQIHCETERPIPYGIIISLQ